MNLIPRRIFAAVLAGTFVLFARPPAAQETPASGEAASMSGEAVSGLTLAEVEVGLTAIEADGGIEDAVKTLLRSKYEEAIKALKEAADFGAQAAGSSV